MKKQNKKLFHDCGNNKERGEINMEMNMESFWSKTGKALNARSNNRELNQSRDRFKIRIINNIVILRSCTRKTGGDAIVIGVYQKYIINTGKIYTLCGKFCDICAQIRKNRRNS